MRKTTRILAVLLAGMTALPATACSQKQEDGFHFDIQETTDEDGFFDSEYETIVTAESVETTLMPVSTAAKAMERLGQSPESDKNYSFRSAVWVAKDPTEDTERYFCFYDNNNGVMLSQQNGAGSAFTCELSATEGVFHFGEAAQESRVTISWTTDTSAVVTWADGKSEIFNYLRDNGAQELQFFSNEQLCTLALDYYEQTQHTRPAMAAALINVDETIAIQLYDVDGDQINTYDWYTVDRYTGTGYNGLNEKISLSGAPIAETQPGETTAETQETQPDQENAPAGEVPSEEAPSEEVTAEEVPAEEVPAEEVPAEPAV